MDGSGQITDELRDKIKSKMDVTKFFAGFIALLIGILLKEEKIMSLRSRAGVIFFVCSLGFCIAAMSAYDHLLWPKKFLTNSDRSEDDVEHFQKTLRAQMMGLWSWLFVPALMCFGLGFFLFLSQEVGLMPFPAVALVERWHLLEIQFVVAFLAPIVLVIWKWPFKSNRGAGRRDKD